MRFTTDGRATNQADGDAHWKLKPLLWYNFYTVFEFDPAKSELNKTKHGIDFEAAQSLWDDPCVLEIPAKTEDEPRYLIVGTIDAHYWSAVITYRGDNIRIISVRRARSQEVALYESQGI